MATGLLDCIATPAQGNKIPDAPWCADNGAFSDKFDERKWWAFLTKNAHRADSCVFAVAPDVVGDAAATLERSWPWLGPIRELGYPVAFVAQNGFDADMVPWDDIDVLFIGGDDEFKLGRDGLAAVLEAKRRGKWVHMGRVNSLRRLRYADWIGCDSADGTFVARGPDVNLPKVLGWLTAVNEQDSLLGGPEEWDA